MAETITAVEWQRRRGGKGAPGYTSCAACGVWKNWTAFLAVLGGKYRTAFACSADCATELGGDAPARQIPKTPVAAPAPAKIVKADTAPNERRTIMIDVNIRITSEDGTFNTTEANVLAALNGTAPVAAAATAPVQQPAKASPAAKKPALKVVPTLAETADAEEPALKAVPTPAETADAEEPKETPAPAPAKKAQVKKAPAVEKDTPEEVAEVEADLEKAVARATELLGAGQAALVKGALKEVGAARVSQLKPSQVQPFLDALADA